jgi:transcriptional regulator with XRE-family HTH domain
MRVYLPFFVSMKEPIPVLTIDELQLQIAKRARQSRLVKGFTQSELSRKSHVSYSSIRKFEKTGEIALNSLLKIAKTLDDSKSFEVLFPGSEFFNFISPRIFKRPKLHINGSYHSTRLLTPRELEKHLDFEDSPNDFPENETPKRDWKKLPKTDPYWDPFEELEKIHLELSQKDSISLQKRTD